MDRPGCELRDVLVGVIEAVAVRDGEVERNPNPRDLYKGAPRLRDLAEALLQLITDGSEHYEDPEVGKPNM
jgi:hypothetical protein